MRCVAMRGADAFDGLEEAVCQRPNAASRATLRGRKRSVNA